MQYTKSKRGTLTITYSPKYGELRTMSVALPVTFFGSFAVGLNAVLDTSGGYIDKHSGYFIYHVISQAQIPVSFRRMHSALHAISEIEGLGNWQQDISKGLKSFNGVPLDQMRHIVLETLERVRLEQEGTAITLLSE